MIEAPWDSHWGKDYDYFRKQMIVQEALQDAEAQGYIGTYVVDVGCGALPLSGHLSRSHKKILIDIAGPQWKAKYGIQLRLDVETLLDSTSRHSRAAIARIARFMQVKESSKERQQVDTFFFSDILNYIDWESVLGEANSYLKPGGSFVIFNMPNRGEDNLFSSRGLKSNTALLDFLSTHGHTVHVEKHIPNKTHPDYDATKDMIFLISQKPAANQKPAEYSEVEW